MKKLFILIAMFASLTVNAQALDESDHWYATVSGVLANNWMASEQHTYPFTYPTYLFSVGIMGKDACIYTDNVRFRQGFSMSFGVSGDDVRASIIPTLGAEVGVPNNPYMFLDIHPRIRFAGNGGPQVNGDYAIFYCTFSLGAGYAYAFNERSSVYVEGSISRDLTVVCTNRRGYTNSVGGVLVLGYRYTIR